MTADAPLLVFRSITGRTFLSWVRPPADFPLATDVREVQRLDMQDRARKVPTINWTSEAPAILYRTGADVFTIGFPDLPCPDGCESFGSEFAFVPNEEKLREAMAADR